MSQLSTITIMCRVRRYAFRRMRLRCPGRGGHRLAALLAGNPLHLLRRRAVVCRTRQSSFGTNSCRNSTPAAIKFCAMKRCVEPERPRKADGVLAGEAGLDEILPGFGPFGTAGQHCFRHGSPAYVRISALIAARKAFPALRIGRQYQRPISNFTAPVCLPAAGELIVWSRILDDEEVVCVVNGHGQQRRGGDVLVDAEVEWIRNLLSGGRQFRLSR